MQEALNFNNQQDIAEFLRNNSDSTLRIECLTCGSLALLVRSGEISVRNDGCKTPHRTDQYQCVVQAVQQFNAGLSSRQEPLQPQILEHPRGIKGLFSRAAKK